MLLIFETNSDLEPLVHCLDPETEENDVVPFEGFDRVFLSQDGYGLTVIAFESTFGLDTYEGLAFPEWDYSFLPNSEGRMTLALEVPSGVGLHWSVAEEEPEPAYRLSRPLETSSHEVLASLREAIITAEKTGADSTELRNMLQKYLSVNSYSHLY